MKKIRKATLADLQAVASIESQCFPPAEAASIEELKGRLSVYPNHFWLLFEGDRLVGFVDGMVSDSPQLRDELFADAGLHQEDGRWQMIFGVNTIPAYRRQGCAAIMLRQAIADAKDQGRQGLVLTCKETLLHYYAKFGFVNQGRSPSVHGGAIWYEMRLTF